ncbi:olfactory receptor 10AG1-like [Sarcophilus harrisii]
MSGPPQMENTRNLKETNLTEVEEFILLGFSDLPKLQGFLFGIFLVVYICILIGNGLIIIITKRDSTLQTPIYFFLGNFSFLEICYTSVSIPRMLWNLGTQKRNISLLACAVQLCFFLILAATDTECFLLAVMAYDRYVAICKPLNYPLIMNHKVCIQLVVVSWISGIPISIVLTYQVFSLSFCGSNKLNHVFCDIPPLLKLACGDTIMTEFSVYILAVLFGMASFLLILWSYIKIITLILKLPSATGRHKAFSTCFSHFIVVSLFYGSIAIMYLSPQTSHSEETDKVLSLFYTILTPMFNPIIYSLRNKDVIAALRKILPYGEVIFPKLLTNFWSHNKNISFLACAIQLGFFLVLGSTECLLVAVMSYDHYVAICKPLNYPLIMNHKFCVQLVVVSWISGIPVQTTLTYLVSSLPFCGSNKLNHVLCDIPPLLKLACGDTSTTELSVYIVAVLFGMISFLLILWSYIKIITVILKLPSATSRYKAFSTCFSHLILVSLFYGSIAIMYLRPKASHSEEIDKVLSLFYTILTPMFNPMIYSLRNKDVITALRKLLLK